jgi:hypothetical protein
MISAMPLKKCLFYRATPDGSISYKKASLNCSKRAMAYVNMFCSSNMSGANKHSLLRGGLSLNALKGLILRVFRFYITLIKDMDDI